MIKTVKTMFCSIGIFLAIPQASALQPQIPPFFHGAWSRDMRSCGHDSDGNYFISSNKILAWEVSWDVVKLIGKASHSIRLKAIDREYDPTIFNEIIIKKKGQSVINFQACEEGHCWQVDLRRCPISRNSP
jgi:hypothetical protein